MFYYLSKFVPPHCETGCRYLLGSLHNFISCKLQSAALNALRGDSISFFFSFYVAVGTNLRLWNNSDSLEQISFCFVSRKLIRRWLISLSFVTAGFNRVIVLFVFVLYRWPLDSLTSYLQYAPPFHPEFILNSFNVRLNAIVLPLPPVLLCYYLNKIESSIQALVKNISGVTILWSYTLYSCSPDYKHLSDKIVN